MFFNNKISNVEEIMYESKNTDNITGLIYKKEYLKQFLNTTSFSVLIWQILE